MNRRRVTCVYFVFCERGSTHVTLVEGKNITILFSSNTANSTSFSADEMCSPTFCTMFHKMLLSSGDSSKPAETAETPAGCEHGSTDSNVAIVSPFFKITGESRGFNKRIGSDCDGSLTCTIA